MSELADTLADADDARLVHCLRGRCVVGMSAEEVAEMSRNSGLVGMTLYRLYDGRDRLLYVTTGDPASLEARPWYADVRVTRLEHFGSRESARAAEMKAVAEERPRYNFVAFP